MRDMRLGANVTLKLDRTAVTNADTHINQLFIQAVRRRNRRDSVVGEEISARRGRRRVWALDPIDGTDEYADPSVPDPQRTSCVGIALIEDGVLVLSVVYNPFRNELFVAERNRPTLLNGRVIQVSLSGFWRGMSYDYCHWDGAPFDARGLKSLLGQPLNVYSAIYQACMVAKGHSEFAVFPGNTLPDIAPATLLVVGAGGRVTDLSGRPINWSNPTSGVLYSNGLCHDAALRAIQGL
jgi:myo-inositol-1(or 4)-monophosphatase